MRGEDRSASQPAGIDGSQAKKPGLDAGDNTDEAEEEAARDPGHIQVNSEVRIRQKHHSITLEELPGTPYDDLENHPA